MPTCTSIVALEEADQPTPVGVQSGVDADDVQLVLGEAHGGLLHAAGLPDER